MRQNKFNPFDWQEIHQDGQIRKTVGGRVFLRASKPVALYAIAVDEDGEVFETLAQLGETVDVILPEGVSWTYECEGRVFLYSPSPFIQQPDELAFTNADRLPHESGNVLAVTAGLRQLEIAKRQMLREITAARVELARERRNADPALSQPEQAEEAATAPDSAE